MDETETISGQQLAEAVENARGGVMTRLRGVGAVDDTDDVLQATWESAWKARESFDPERGSVQAWVSTIAARRAVDHVRQVSRARDGQEAMQAASVAREQTAVTMLAPDHAEALVAALDAQAEVARVMRVVEQVMDSREMTARALAVVLVFDDDIPAAARAMGLSQDVLRQARREVIRCARVVRQAQAVAVSGDEVTMRTLIGCLPGDGDAGDWTRQVAMACAMAGGRLEDVTVGHVMQATGFSHSTARQYLAEARHLLRVAATVIEQTRKELA